MNLVVRSLLMMSLLLTLANCSNDGSKPFTNEYDDQSAADQFVNNFDLQCDGPCLEGVGGLLTTSETIKHGYFVTTTSYSVGFCSQTLIGPDLVLTNRHCLSDKVNQYKGRSCGEMTAVFPAQNGKPAQRVKCASIVDMSEDLEADKDGKIEKNGADWAILRLAQTVNRKYFKVNTNGVPHDSKIVAHPVIYEKGWDDRVKHGRIRKAECTSKMNHSSSAFYISPQSLLVTSDCNINFPSGSSGSGMTLNNEVVYVHNSGPPDNEIRDYRFYGETYYTSKDYSKGTNTHCISAFNAKPSIACKVDTGDEKSKTIGKAHRILSGHYQSDEALVQFRNFLQTEQRAEFSNFYDSGDSQFQAASSVGQFTNFLDFAEDTVLRKTNNTFFPVRVRCIHREKFGEQSGDLKIPFFYQASQGSILNIKDGTLTLPMNIQFMQVRLTYSPDNNVYQIRLPRLEGDDQVSFQNLLVEQEVEKTKCVFSPNPDRCREFVETMQEIETLTDPNSEGSSIYSNEIVFKLEELSFGFGFSRAETKIPACEEASEAI